MKTSFASSLMCGALILSSVSAGGDFQMDGGESSVNDAYLSSMDPAPTTYEYVGTLGNTIAAATETEATTSGAPVTMSADLKKTFGIDHGAIETPPSEQTGLSIDFKWVPDVPSTVPGSKSNEDPTLSKEEPMWNSVPSSESPSYSYPAIPLEQVSSTISPPPSYETNSGSPNPSTYYEDPSISPSPSVANCKVRRTRR
ncbi:uncharacterized protein PHALS_03959 [Plasmopara halstedii]|uniref:RxLR-like protein n=1 Tax=Plasmopara halstedii TaxID=4781 RepID=A0A0P1AXW9_PLAHL|nr:uncharacterized protein PHALS_03959 [Plasmopara halstedii]CEG47304.1 hypothetical protein PHALS_03959 [Plasmopara halstedii]|eukprot:XP_024583673.1 hypothetical protein PHALS_03959 [Plasmopara halstedii]